MTPPGALGRRLPGNGIPDIGMIVLRSRDKPGAVRTELHGMHSPSVTKNRQNRLILDLPNTGSPVCRRSSDSFSSAVEIQTFDLGLVLQLLAVGLAVLSTPQACRAVPGSRRSQPPAGMKPRCPNLVTVLELEKLNARFRIPDSCRPVLRRAQDEPAIGAEFGPADMIVVL